VETGVSAGPRVGDNPNYGKGILGDDVNLAERPERISQRHGLIGA
jgi:hypothetical protein